MQVVMDKVEQEDIASCCAKKGVSEQCLPACSSSRGIDIDFAFSRHQCLNELGHFLLCARGKYITIINIFISFFRQFFFAIYYLASLIAL